MSDIANAPVGGESASAPTVITPAADTGENLSVSQAARALAAARHKPKEQAAPVQVEQPQELAQEANADPETVPSAEPTEAEPAVEQSPIEPPRSWTKEAKDRWESLPRETQEYLAHREQERDREVRRSQNEAAETRKAIEAERDAVGKARQEYEAKLPAVMQALQDANAGAFGDIKTVEDVQKLAAEDPFRYVQWQAHQQKMQAVQYELTKAEERKSQEQSSQWTDHVQKENQLFAEKVPEFADKAKAKELTDKAVVKLQDIGFTDQELGELATGKSKLSIFDHRVQLLILDALKYADTQKAKAVVSAKPLPPVQRPGVAKPQGAAAAENIQALTNKLAQTGSLKDAQALRAAQIGARR